MSPLLRSHENDSQTDRNDSGRMRRAIGYIRVSTDMQAADGLSLAAQTAAIEQYCALHGIKLNRIY